MNVMTTRTFRISWVFALLVALVIGALTVDDAAAKPNNGTNKLSISQRVKNFEENCEDLDGEASISYSYEDGKLVGANASCSGGGLGGTNCTFTSATTDCYQEPKTITSGTGTVQTGLMAKGNVVIAQGDDDTRD